MEVHAHTPRKKWTHYFWEFLMLFLAVCYWFSYCLSLYYKKEGLIRKISIKFTEITGK